ncbi:MAG: branched-chain amino acid aminotransferase [Candidatus Margulisbacteria bacterium]|nr:branched-chain amino acid aminotransferase [Candidatus Margulisiibacteriota bacterium]
MANLLVRNVEIHHPRFIGFRKMAGLGPNPDNPAIHALRRKGMLGVYYDFNRGGQDFIVKGRLDDLSDTRLVPSLSRDSAVQAFVDGPVLQRAHNVLTETPQLIARARYYNTDKIDFDNLSFGLTPTDAMFFAEIKANGQWPAAASLVPFGNIPISPAAGVLNYGQGLFEGMKAYRTENGGIALFRPLDNARRAQNGAKRLGLTPVQEEIFLDAVERVVLANERFIPPYGKGALYIRPLLIGSGGIMGVAPAPENTFIVFATPVGPYFKGGLTGISLKISDEHHRAPAGGIGNVKGIGNYAPGMVPAQEAKALGFAELIYLDAQKHTYLEEAGAANIFVVMNGELYTPALSGTILPGITRDSVIELAKARGYRVHDKQRLSRELLASAEAVFVTGTAAVIAPVTSITDRGNKIIFNDGRIHPIVSDLHLELTGIQEGRIADPFGWVHALKA